MKKLLIMAIVSLMVAGTAVAKGGGMGGGMGMGGQGQGMGQGMQGQGMRLPADFKPVTQDQADKIMSDYLGTNLKGYEVTDSTTFDGKRFTGYKYTVTDANGTTFDIIVNAKGEVRGPFTVK